MNVAPSPDRRAPSRPSDPLCPSCRGSSALARVRTDCVIYYVCNRCSHVWALDKPQPEHKMS